MINLRTIIVTIAIILLITMSGGIAWLWKQWRAAEAEKANVQALYSEEQKKVEVYTSDLGQQVTRNEAVTLENKTLHQMIKDGQFSQAKNLEGINRRMSNLEHLYQMSIKVQDSLRIKLSREIKSYVDQNGDTILFQATSFKHSDKWSSFKAVQITPDSTDFVYDVGTGEVTGAIYWKRKVPILWIFSKKEWYGEVTAENPHVKIPTLTNIRVGKGKK